MCLTGGLLRGMVILLLDVLLFNIGEVCDWCRVSLVINRCVDLFLGSKLCVVSCYNGCAGVVIKSFSILGVVFSGDSGGCCCVIFGIGGVMFLGSKFCSDRDVAAPLVDSCRNR